MRTAILIIGSNLGFLPLIMETNPAFISSPPAYQRLYNFIIVTVHSFAQGVIFFK